MNKEGVIMTKDIAKYLKTFFVIMFYFTYNNIAVYILKRFGIDKCKELDWELYAYFYKFNN